jgi:hypothetical protein
MNKVPTNADKKINKVPTNADKKLIRFPQKRTKVKLIDAALLLLPPLQSHFLHKPAAAVNFLQVLATHRELER